MEKPTERVKRDRNQDLRRYRSLFLDMPDGVFATDERGHIVDWNRSMERICGTPCHSVLNREIWEVWGQVAEPMQPQISPAPDLEPIARQALKQGISKRSRIENLYAIHTPKGEPRIASLLLFSKHETEGAHSLVGVLRDVTLEYQAKDACMEQKRLLYLMGGITEAAMEFTEVNHALGAIVEKIKELTSAENCLIILKDVSQPGFRLAAITGALDDLRTDRGVVQMCYSIASKTLANDAPLVLEDFGNLYQKSGANPSRLHTMLGLPLKTSTIELGAMLIGFEKAPVFTEDLLDGFIQASDLVALVVTKTHLIEEIRQHAEEIDAVASVSSALRKIIVLSDLMHVLLGRIAEILQSDSNCIMLLQEGELTVASVLGVCHDVVGSRVSPDAFPINMALQSNEPIFLSDLSALPGNRVERRDESRGKINSAAFAPLRVAQSLIGLLQVGYLAPHEFSDGERRIVTLIAEIASIAIQRMQLTETLEKRIADRTRELASLYQLTLIARDAQDISVTLQDCIQQVVKAMRCQLGMVHLFSADGNFLNLAASHGFSPENMANLNRLPKNEGFWSKVIRNAHASVVDINQVEPYLPLEAVETGQATYAGALMHAAGRIVGVLGAINTVGGKFSNSDLALLEAMADHIAAAIETINLNKRMEQMAVDEERARLSRELHDSVTQALYSMTLFAESGRIMAEKGDLERAQNYLSDIYDLARQSLKEMRLFIYELRPPALAKEKLVGAIRQRLEAIEQRAGVNARLLVEELIDLPSDVEETLFRVAQEALNNILKHAQADNVKVFLRRKEQLVELEIQDDGVGIELHQAEKWGGMGLSIMRERLEKLGGTIQILSSPNQGTRVIASVPLEGRMIY